MEHPMETQWRLDMSVANLLKNSVDEPPEGFAEYFSNLVLTGKFNGWTE